MVEEESCYVKLGSVNCWGMNRNTKRTIFINWLKDLNYDIIFLQDTHSAKKNQIMFNMEWEGDVHQSTTQNTFKAGVAILIKSNIQYTLLSKYTDEQGRIILLNIELYNDIITLCCVYVPTKNNSKIEFLKELKVFITTNRIADSNLILAGDFNICLLEDDRNTKMHLSDKSRQIFEDFIQHFRLIDVWHIDKREYHRYNWTNHDKSVKSRLDYYL